MWTVISGVDRTSVIPYESIHLEQTANDPAPKLSFDVRDNTASLDFEILDEVVVWNEAGRAQGTVRTIPAHNLVQIFLISDGSIGAWSLTGPLTSIISSWPDRFPVVTFSNNTYSGGNNYGLLTAQTPNGYIRAGQQYMLSVYANVTTPLVNAMGFMEIDWHDVNYNYISTLVGTFTTSVGNQRMKLIGTAPTNAAYALLFIGGQATVSGTNSGVINYGTPQMEPMYFAANGLVSYPTPDCNQDQEFCSAMPDNTTSRAVRLFSGYISNKKVEYLGPVRIWHIECAGPGRLLEDGQINASFVGFTDAQIINTLIPAYFSGKIAIGPPNYILPDSIATGTTLSSVTYTDNTLREVMNQLIGQSSFVYFVDAYYHLYYQPQYALSAPFALSDNPDNIVSFPYYAYQLEDDGTQLQQNIKVKGGDFDGAVQDVFSGNGSTKQFTLTYIPGMVAQITVGGAAKRLGVYGRDTFVGPFDALVNTQAHYVVFNVAPPSASNNVVISYTYKAMIAVTATINTTNNTAPAYVRPDFDTKVNDTGITDLTTATVRGLTEIAKNGTPLRIITCKSQQFASAGQSIYFTSTSDGIINTPFVVQSVSGVMLGKSPVFGKPINEYSYKLGAYQHSLVDHIRNVNKSLNRSALVANTIATQQTDFVAMESVGWNDSITPN